MMKKFNLRKYIALRMPNGYNRPIHIAVILMVLLGVAMVTSAGMTKDTTNRQIVSTLVNALVFAVAGYYLMVQAARNFSLVKIRAHLFTIVAITGVLLLLPRLLGMNVNGAYAWIPVPLGVFNFTFQPSELAKVVIIIVFALYLGDRKNPKTSLFDLVKMPVLILVIYAGIIVFIQKDLGSALVLLGIAVLCFFLPSHPVLTLPKRLIMIAILLGLMLGLWLMSPSGIRFLSTLTFLPDHYIKRLSLVSNPFADRYDAGFQIIAGLLAFARGGLTGVGFGQSLIKYRDLTAAQTDMILSIIVEELGFLFGFLPILIGYAVIIFQSFKYAFKAPLETDKIILLGGCGFLFMHFLLNVGGITALIPLTGVPLLFISKGGTSLLMICLMMGIMQQVIAKNTRQLRKKADNENHRG